MNKFLFLILLLGFYLFQYEGEEITIAACPTFHYLLEDAQEKGIKVVKTGSTAESLALFLAEEVDVFLSGRRMKPTEPEISFKIIGQGYSFLYQEEIFILEEEMEDYLFFTDLDPEKVRLDFPYIKKIERVDDVYGHLNRGVVVTSVENTDYSKAKMVSVIGGDGLRLRLSRTPILYGDPKKINRAVFSL